MGSETEKDQKHRDMNQKEKDLLEWVRNIGFVHQNIEITDTVHGRGLVATEDLPADTVIIKVFYSLIDHKTGLGGRSLNSLDCVT